MYAINVFLYAKLKTYLTKLAKKSYQLLYSFYFKHLTSMFKYLINSQILITIQDTDVVLVIDN